MPYFVGRTLHYLINDKIVFISASVSSESPECSSECGSESIWPFRMWTSASEGVQLVPGTGTGAICPLGGGGTSSPSMALSNPINDWTGIWRFWKPGQNDYWIILVAWRGALSRSEGSRCLEWCCHGRVAQGNNHVTARSQSFPAELCIVTRYSLLFKSLFTGFNILADWCTMLLNPIVESFIVGFFFKSFLVNFICWHSSSMSWRFPDGVVLPATAILPLRVIGRQTAQRDVCGG